jgi:hypothetical protein
MLAAVPFSTTTQFMLCQVVQAWNGMGAPVTRFRAQPTEKGTIQMENISNLTAEEKQALEAELLALRAQKAFETRMDVLFQPIKDHLESITNDEEKQTVINEMYDRLKTYGEYIQTMELQVSRVPTLHHSMLNQFRK